MIPSRPNPWLKSFFAGVVETRMRKMFARVRVRGLEQVQSIVDDVPIIFISNHTSWWDPMFLIWLSTRLVPMDGYAMMDARNLKRLPFLGRLGGYGVFLDDKQDRQLGIEYSIELLTEPGRAVWIFPQGKECPITQRPLEFKPGAAIVARAVKSAHVLPVAFRYEFGRSEHADMLVSIGAPLLRHADIDAAKNAQEAAVMREMDRIEDMLCSGASEHEFATLLRQSTPVIGTWFERTLARFTAH